MFLKKRICNWCDKKIIIVLVSLVNLIFCLSGCDYSFDKSRTRSEKIASSPTINIGLVWPFSIGPKSFVKGITIASDEINLSGGVIGKKINLILKDDDADITHGMEIADNFAADYSVSGVLGFRDSYVVVPVSNIYVNAGLFMMSTTAASPKYNAMNSPLLFRTISGSSEIASKVTEVIKELNLKRVVIFYADNEYGLSLANFCEDKLSDYSIPLIDRRSYKTGTSVDLTQIIDQWQFLEIDCVIVLAEVNNGIKLIEGLRERKMDVPVFCGDLMNSTRMNEMPAAYTKNVIIPSFFNPYLAGSPRSVKFINEYKKRYNSLPDSYASIAYDSLILIAKAISAAQSAEPRKIAAALKNFKAEPGANGTYTFDEYGAVIGKKIFLKIIKNKEIVYLDPTNEVNLIKEYLSIKGRE